jgi:hypothetical protein
MIRFREILGHVAVIPAWTVKNTFISILADLRVPQCDEGVASTISEVHRAVFLCSAPTNPSK